MNRGTGCNELSRGISFIVLKAATSVQLSKLCVTDSESATAGTDVLMWGLQTASLCPQATIADCLSGAIQPQQ